MERIVQYMARRIGNNVDIDELRSYAMDGLAQAINKYDPSLGVPIAGFAAKRIRGAIFDGLARNRMLPRRLIRQITFIRQSEEMMKYEQTNPPPQDKVETVHRLANRLKDLACAYVTTSTAATEEQIESDAVTNSEFIIDRKKYYEKIKVSIETLPEQQQTLIRQFYFDEKNLKQIAEELGKSKSWASRNLQIALRNMREHFES